MVRACSCPRCSLSGSGCSSYGWCPASRAGVRGRAQAWYVRGPDKGSARLPPARSAFASVLQQGKARRFALVWESSGESRINAPMQKNRRRHNKSARTSLLSVLLLLSLAACGEGQNESKAPKVDEEAALLKDIQRAMPELERRLRERMSVQDGLILVIDPEETSSSSYVLPTNSPWVISCGFGLSVVFGTAVSGDGSGVDNDVKIHLTQRLVTEDACSVLAPQLGRRVRDML